MTVAVWVLCLGSFAGANNIDLNLTAMALREDGDNGRSMAIDGQQQQETQQSKCLMFWARKKRKNRKKKVMAINDSNSTSSVAASWEKVDGDSCRCSEFDQESAVLDSSADGQTPEPASPNDLLRPEGPQPKSDGDPSQNPTESSPAMLVCPAAFSDDDSLVNEFYNDDGCKSLSDELPEAGSPTPTPDAVASQ